jgi:uncharacterized repeat protein (TIGR02543 family)
MRKRAKRIYGILLSMSMLITLLSVPVWAAEPVETGAGYEQEQKQEHAQEQKQIQEQGQAQNPEHEHTQGCYTLTKNCVHEHAAECYPQTNGTGTVSGNNITETVEAQPTACTHVCSEESGCITKEWNCGYNTENNGASETVGTTQGTGTVEDAEKEAEIVTVESVQAMINALPDAEEISADSAEEVAEQLEAIDKAKAKLSDEELNALDFSKYMKAAAALGGLSVPMLTANGSGEVTTADELTAALANGSVPMIKLMQDITINSTLIVDRAVTLDLNGCVLKMTGSGSVIQIKSGGSLTLEDNNASSSHKFTPNSNGLWELNNNGTETVLGGVITGGTGTQVPIYGPKGGGVYIEPEGNLMMNGGSIVGCKANYGGGVQIEYDGNNKKYGAFVMNGGSIVGCEAQCGGGVVIEEGCNFTMYSGSKISYCTAKKNAYGGDGYGGGIMINGGEKLGVFTMNGGEIHNCTAGNYGGGIDNSGTFVMNGGQIHSCTAGSYGGVRNIRLFIMSGGTIGNPNDHRDTSHVGNQSGHSVLTISGNAEIRTNVINGNVLNADGGEISGEVTNGIDGNFGRIMGSEGASGSTTFSSEVTNNVSDYKVKSIIEKGTFTGSVTNNGSIISGGDFSKANLSGNLEITFEPGNGDPDIIQEVEWKNNGEKLTEPKPVKESYTLEGWYYDDNGTEKKWDFGKDRTIYTMTLKAKWKENTYTVKLEANGGTIANGKEVTGYTYGTDVTLPTKDDIIRNGYTFEGWYTDSSFSGTPVTGISSNDGGNKTFYAKWTANTYTVKLETNGGKIADGKDVTAYTCGIGEALPGVGDITREGYTFEGWYTDSSFSGSPVTKISSTDTGDKTFYAKWTANTYTVKLEANGGKIADGKDVTAYTCGIGEALPGVGDITREGYTFEGWYTDSSFYGSPVTEIAGSDTGNKTFYAKWKQNTVPVIPVETKPKDTNHENISRNNTNSNNTDYYDTGDTNESSGSGDIALIICPTLTFDTCGGSGIKAVHTFKGHTINLSGYLPIREGYEFSGWYADQNLTQPITEIRLNGNRTVYAGWISRQPLIEEYKPGSSDIPEDMEDQITEDQVTEEQITEEQVLEDKTTEEAGDDQKSTVENNPTDNNSKPDDSTDLPSEDRTHSGGWIPVICIPAGALVIGSGLYLGFRRRKKTDKK